MSLKNINPNIGNLMESSIIRNILDIQSRPTPKVLFSENPAHKTNKTIEELKDIIVEQGITADKQANNTKWLTVLALVLAFISIIPVLREYIPILLPKNQNRDIYKLKEKVLLISNTNHENEIRLLKVENELLKSKKTSEKEKNLP